MTPPLVTGPIPLYNNPPIEPQYFQPSQFFISALTTGVTTTVTTSVNNNYVIGQLVRLLIPNGYGCTQLNEITGYVISTLSSNQVVVNIDSSKANQFISASLPNRPQIIAIGDISSGAINISGNMRTSTFIPGSFQNISPL